MQNNPLSTLSGGDKAAIAAELWLLFLCIGAAFGLCFWGDFPLNDDWAYARNVRYLVEDARIYFDPWPAQTLIAQTLWGAAFSKLFGFSFTVLRLSTMVAAWVAVRYFYGFLRLLGCSLGLSLLGACWLLLNPFFFTLSYSFMTEIPFMAASFGSVYHFSRYLQAGRWLDYGLLLLFALLAIMIRQHGLILPIGLGLGLLLHKATNAKLSAAFGLNFRHLLLAGLPFVLVLSALLIYNHWREANYGLSAAYGQAGSLTLPFSNGTWDNLLYHRVGTVGFYLGLFFAPVCLPAFWRLWQGYQPRTRYLFGAYLLLTVVYYQQTWNVHTIGNVFYNWGLNPELLKDTVERNDSVTVSRQLWSLLKWFATLNGAVFYWLCGYSVYAAFGRSCARSATWRAWVGAGLLSSLLYGAIIVLGQYYFDRYHLPFLLFTTLLLLPVWGLLEGQSRRSSYLIVALYGLFALLATRDYINFNRSRTAATDYLTRTLGVSPSLIDGGFEFNGWANSYHIRPQNHPSGASWWFVDKDEYIVGCKPRPLYQPLDTQFVFFRTLTMATDTIFIYKKAPLASSDTVQMQVQNHQNPQLLTAFDYQPAPNQQLTARCWVCGAAANANPKGLFYILDPNQKLVEWSQSVADSSGGCLLHELQFIPSDTLKAARWSLYWQLIAPDYQPKGGAELIISRY